MATELWTAGSAAAEQRDLGGRVDGNTGRAALRGGLPDPALQPGGRLRRRWLMSCVDEIVVRDGVLRRRPGNSAIRISSVGCWTASSSRLQAAFSPQQIQLVWVDDAASGKAA